ncbi:hypothetical protein C0V78_03355 [Novosphingobium sp. TH158]|nr:hypothetical protein C0V78_03355 [Novosphingobium sp. TH158]
MEGLRIMPIKVTADSRCPINARCIWAGELRAKVKVSQKGHQRTLELVQGKPADLGWATVELVDALPQPRAGRKIAPPYRLKFRVERRDRMIPQSR